MPLGVGAAACRLLLLGGADLRPPRFLGFGNSGPGAGAHRALFLAGCRGGDHARITKDLREFMIQFGDLLFD